ncbi:MAG TPA: tail fiber domain-containing protein [Chthoniobacterales bacterium]|nr:tail fiber domain-containing protein [Chthoniobacterales bacterium]
MGEDALLSGGSGEVDSTALGYEALYSSTGGVQNTAVGWQAMYHNTTGGANVGIGAAALDANTTGQANVGVGLYALVANTTGTGNVAVGSTALQAHASGFQNVAIGYGAMSIGTTGDYNTAIGNSAMAFSSGSENTALGDSAMNKATGSDNVAMGRSAGLNLAGSGNIVIGQYSGQNLTKGSNNIEIGNQGVKKDDAIIRIGAVGAQKQTFIAGISGATISNGVAVMVNSKGQLGVATSSARFKDDIQPMKDASDVLLALQPVTFRYKKELDSLGTPQFGLVAEQVAKVDPDLVARDEQGQPYTVRYEAVNAMLLNEFLKEHRKVQTLETRLAEQDKINAEMRAALAAQAAQIQKVSAQVQVARGEPQVAAAAR